MRVGLPPVPWCVTAAQGKHDTFVFKMPDLGDLKELEIWHDGKGFGAGWHLDFVEVHSSATGKVRRGCALRAGHMHGVGPGDIVQIRARMAGRA